MRIAFLVGVFPRFSETFILNQMLGVLEAGHELHIFAGKQGPLKSVHPEIHRLNLLKQTTFPPPCLGLRSLHAAIQHPGAFAISARYGRACSLSRLLPALASCRELRNFDIIHAHFGTNGLKAVALRELGITQGKIITTFYGQDVGSMAVIATGSFLRKVTGFWASASTWWTWFADSAVTRPRSANCTSASNPRTSISGQGQLDLANQSACSPSPD